MATQVASLFARIGAETSGFKQGAADVKKSLGDMQHQTQRFQASSLVSWGAIAGAVYSAKRAFDFTKEGAQLDFAATRFDRLAESVGVTSRVLLGDLREATRGIYSDAQLMEQAGDMMALGLAKTREEAVRLATVAGGLNMNMNQLTLTLTNKTTMRFDALGVAVDGFQEKVDALVAAGMDADAAFNEAFLQQAEEQIEKVGNAADTALGSIMKFEAQGSNYLDRFSKAAGRFSGPLFDFASAWLEDQNRMAEGYERQQRAMEEVGGLWTFLRLEGGDLVKVIQLANGEIISMADAIRLSAKEWPKLKTAAEQAAASLENAFNFDVKLNIASDISQQLDQIAFSMAGGDWVESIFTQIQQNAPKIGADKTTELLSGLFVQANARQVVAGLLDPEEARKAIVEQLNLSGAPGGVSADAQAQYMIDLALAPGAQNKFEQEIAAALSPIEEGTQGVGELQESLNSVNGEFAEHVLRASLLGPIGEANSSLRGIIRGLMSLEGQEFSVNINVNGMPKTYQGYNVQAIQGGHATGGVLGSRGDMVSVGEQGEEGVYRDPKTGEWVVIPHGEWMRKKRQMLMNGFAPKGRAVGGPLAGTPPPPSAGGWYKPPAIQNPQGEGPPGFVDPRTGNPNPSWLVPQTPSVLAGRGSREPRESASASTAARVAANTAAAVAEQASVTAAQAAAAAVGSSLASQSQQQATQAIAAFTQQTSQQSANLLEETKAQTEAIRNLPTKNDLKNAVREALAEAI